MDHFDRERGMQMHLFCIFLHRNFCSLNLHPPGSLQVMSPQIATVQSSHTWMCCIQLHKRQGGLPVERCADLIRVMFGGTDGRGSLR